MTTFHNFRLLSTYHLLTVEIASAARLTTNYLLTHHFYLLLNDIYLVDCPELNGFAIEIIAYLLPVIHLIGTIKDNYVFSQGFAHVFDSFGFASSGRTTGRSSHTQSQSLGQSYIATKINNHIRTLFNSIQIN